MLFPLNLHSEYVNSIFKKQKTKIKTNQKNKTKFKKKKEEIPVILHNFYCTLSKWMTFGGGTILNLIFPYVYKLKCWKIICLMKNGNRWNALNTYNVANTLSFFASPNTQCRNTYYLHFTFARKDSKISRVITIQKAVQIEILCEVQFSGAIEKTKSKDFVSCFSINDVLSLESGF